MRSLLENLVFPTLSEPIRYSPVLEASLKDLIRSVKAQGLEGVVAKRGDSPYGPALECLAEDAGQPGAGICHRRLRDSVLLKSDYERLPETTEAIIHIAMIRLMVRRRQHDEAFQTRSNSKPKAKTKTKLRRAAEFGSAHPAYEGPSNVTLSLIPLRPSSKLQA
jgi:hypothetical protein